MRVRKYIRYSISSIYMMLGYIIGFVAIFNGLSIYNYCENYEKDVNDYKYRHNKDVFINTVDEKTSIDMMYFMNLKKYNYYIKDNVCLYFNENKESRIVDVLLNVNEETNYCFIEGRLPNKKEVEQGKNVIAIGKGIKNQTYIVEDKRYIDIYSIPYEVVGIIGTKMSKAQDYKVVTYYKCLDENSRLKVSLNEMYLSISSNKENIDMVDVEEYCKMNKSIEQKVINNEEIEGSLLSDDKLRGDFYILVFIFSIVNCMIICEFWIHQRRREIAIRKAYGYSNMQVVKLITSSMFKIIIASCVCGYLLQVCFSHIMEQQGIKFEWSVLNIIRVIILIIMTTIISMVVPICKIIKRTPIQELTQKGVI